MIKIDKPIIGWSVSKKESDQENDVIKEVNKHPPILERPTTLSGKTYKIKTQLCDNSLYITINDIEVNGRVQPFEIFINSKSMEHFQWIIALTRVISSVFRHGGEVDFIIEELQSIIDPKGGYFKKGGKYMPSLVAEIGEVLKEHMISIGYLKLDDSLAKSAVAMIEEKTSGNSEKNMIQCTHCNQYAMILMDGCLTCTSCGYSKCG